MRRIVEPVIAILGFLAGLALLAAYIVLAVRSDDFREDLADLVMLGVGGVFLILLAAIFVWSSRRRADRGEEQGTIRLPPVWLSLALFALAVGLGFATTHFDVALEATPLLSVIAAGSIALIVLRVAAWWVPGRRGTFRATVRPGVWGMVGATTLSGLAQAIAIAAMVGGIALGLYIYDPDLATASPLQDALDDLTQTEDTELPAILTAPTIAVALFGVLAIIAPLSEELLKFLGVLLVGGRSRPLTEYSAFIAGVAAGLGFAVVEALGYALIAPLNWPAMMLLRAPVVLIHVAGTSIVALGWYQQRRRGGLQLLWYYVIAVLLHAGWNGMLAALVLTAAGVEDTANPDALSALMMLLLVGGIGGLWFAATIWFVANARRLGREVAERTTTLEAQPVPSLIRHGSPSAPSLAVHQSAASPSQHWRE